MRGGKPILILSLVAEVWCASGLRARAADPANLVPELQAAFDRFPLLRVETNDAGAPEFQTLKLEKSVGVNGEDYYGFRFTVPPRRKHEDFAWAFVVPGKLSEWYIVAQKGETDGFDFYYKGRTRDNYVGTEHLFPTAAKQLYLQTLPGTSIEDGQTYLIWFVFRDRKPNQMSLKFTFADLGKKENRLPAVEKALGLKLRKR